MAEAWQPREPEPFYPKITYWHGRASSPTGVAVCSHNHRTKDAAKRCSEKMAAHYSKTQTGPEWTWV